MADKTLLWDGAVLYGYKEDDIYRWITDQRAYFEEEHLKSWKKWTDNVDCIFDIGANLGNHTVFWGKHTKISKIYAWEPYPLNYRLLCRNIEANGLRQVETCPFAAGDHCGTMYLAETVSRSSLGNARFSYLKPKDYSGSILPTEGMTIDSFVFNKQTIPVGFIKIDVEGMADCVLEGAKQTLCTLHPTIWVECEADNCLKITSLLSEAGYFLVDVMGANLLFAHPKRCGEVREYDWKKLLPAYLDMRIQMLEISLKYYQLKDVEKR